MQSNTTSFLSSSLLAACLSIGLVCAPSHAATPLGAADLVPGQLVISEIMANPAKVDDTVGEWFEVFNPLAVPVNLGGLIVESQKGNGVDAFAISGALIVAPGGFAVLGANADTSVNGGMLVNFAWGNTISLGNSSDSVNIRTSDGVSLVKVTWTSSASGASAEVHGGTLPTLVQADLATTAAGHVYGLGDRGTPGFANVGPLNVAGIVAAPVPEPATYAMVAAGLGLLALARRRRIAAL